VNPPEICHLVRQRVPNPLGVAAAVGALSDHARHIDLAVDGRRIFSKSIGRGGDAFHACLGVDDQHNRQIEGFGNHRGAGAVAVIQTHHALDNADIALAASVVASKAGVAFEPQVERTGGSARNRLVVARIDEIGAGFGWLDGVARVVECANDGEGCDRFTDAGTDAAEDEAVHTTSRRTTNTDKSENGVESAPDPPAWSASSPSERRLIDSSS